MQLVKSLAFVLLLLSVVSCYEFYDDYYWSEGNGDTIEYYYLPSNQLGTFEGSYTSNSHLGFGLNICQDGTTIYGSYDQLGVFNGVVNKNVANGTWYQAGTTNCVTGSFQLTLTSDGFTGYYTCGKAPTKITWNETKLSPFRPADTDCALMNLNSTFTLSGRFVDTTGLPKDFCYSGKDSNASISFLYLDSNNEQQKAFFSGTAYGKGQIFLGTWYTLQPLAGADLYYLDDVGGIQSFYWTGLNGTSGQTLINPGEYYQPQYHGTRYYTGPIGSTDSSNCGDYSTIKTKVLNNLIPNLYDDDLYYFVSTAFNYVNDDDGNFLNDDGALDDDYFVNDASHIYWFFLPVLLALFF